ncbi:hypothetical protein AAAC51_07425 [Priestia megaterium]
MDLLKIILVEAAKIVTNQIVTYLLSIIPTKRTERRPPEKV